MNKIDPEGRFLALANLLVSHSIEAQLRKMDYKVHMNIFRKAESKLDAFSVINLQRGVAMDLFVADVQGDLQETLRDSAISAIGLVSPNLERLLSFASETWDKRKAIQDILEGVKQWDDFVGEEIPETIIEELL